MQAKTKDYFTTREAAKLLGVAVSTIQMWTNSGLLKAWTTAGGHRRIAKKSVEGILKQQATIHENENLARTVTSLSDNPVSIVVVEDNEQEIILYKKKFELWNMDATVHICNDGYEGLMIIGKLSPDIIISDLMMPNMDGFEMLRAIRKKPELEHCKLIAVSALTEDEIKHRGGLPEDVIAFRKPLPFNELKKLIQKSVVSG